MTADQTADALMTLLDEERGRLRAGELDGLDDITRRKEALIAELSCEDAVLPDHVARDLTQALVRNAALLGAAAEGIGRARTRIAEIRAGERGLGTYGADGTRSEIGGPRRSFERKA